DLRPLEISFPRADVRAVLRVILSAAKDLCVRRDRSLAALRMTRLISKYLGDLAGLLQSLGVQTSLEVGCCSGGFRWMVRIRVSFGQESVNAGGPMWWESSLADRPWPIPRHFDTPF